MTIGNGTGVLDRSCGAYDTVNNRWLLQFDLQGIPGHSYDQFAQLIGTNGTFIGGEIPIATTPGFEGDTGFGGDVAWLPSPGRDFSVYGLDNGIGGQEFDAAGNAVALPMVLGLGYFDTPNNAADTKLNRWLTVWEGLLNGQRDQWYIFGRLYQPATIVLPIPAAGPSPADGSTAIGINADLSWTPGNGAVSHDVYWGTTNPPAFRINQSGTSYDPGTMAMSTTYYWRINEVNVAGTDRRSGVELHHLGHVELSDRSLRLWQRQPER